MLIRSLLLAATLVLASSCIPKQPDKPRVPALEKVYKIKSCVHCPKLLAELKANNVKTTDIIEIGPSQPVPWFPACIYSDGATDAGERVYEKRCYFAKTVLVIEWVDTRKDK